MNKVTGVRLTVPDETATRLTDEWEAAPKPEPEKRRGRPPKQ